MSSSIIALLKKDQLTGENYATWKSKLNMILVIVDLSFVLMEECPPFPTKHASQSVRDAYDRWTKANDKARLHILASMSDILSKKHEIMVTARQIMDSLREMFGQPSIQIKQEANVAHSKRRFVPSPSGSEKIQKRKEGKGKGPTIAVEDKGKAKVAIKRKCFHCNVDEHWKTNCPKYLVKKKEKEGATNHVCSSLQETSSFKQLEDSEMTLKVGTGDVISARAVGDAKLGHINLDRIGRLVKNGLLNKLKDVSLPPCESCLEGKMTKRPFTGKGYRAKEPLELIHSDLCGPMNVKARGGFEYFISFIDDYSRYGYLYLMEHKSEALEKFKEYKTEVENLLSKKIKILRSDRGGEYMDLRFQDYMIEHGIQSQLSAPGTPQQNGVSERRNRTLLDMVRSMMSYAQLPSSFWGYAVETAVHILNNVPSKSVSETPFELWRGRKPSLSHFRIWGCPAHVLVTNPKKLEPRSRLCQFVGYPKETRGGLFFDPQENRVFVSTNATFLEEDHMRNHKPRSKLVLSEATDESTRVVDEVGPSSRVDETTTSGQSHPSQSLRMPRRSGRVVSQPNRYLGLTETQVVIPDDGVEDPLSYKQAMNDVDKDQWVKAMDLEMESMYFNSVWELVDLPEGVKPIGCKWIYKRKRDSAGKVQTFKARLVAKGYTQREGVDYEETFSPVAMLKSIRILLSIATFYDYEIWQMDVKTAFLNGNLEESIFMSQPERFITQGQEQKVCKLNLSIYGLKQASRSWNIRHGVHLSKEQCPKTPQEVEDMRRIPYASAVGSLMYAMLCTRPDICYAVGIVSRRTRYYMLVYGVKDLILIRYTDSDFQTDKDSRKSISGSVFTLNVGAIVWRSIKQGCIADSTMEAEYVAACEVAKEAVWLRKFLHDLEVVPNMNLPITLYCDNSGAVANSKEPRSHKRGKHIERKYHLIREIVQRGDVIVTKIDSEHNIADPFTKTLTAKVFEGHLESLGLRDMYIR
ncbi:gag/pol protein [Cucumis melo var. makuwa]|uniref:Gag/pol protein n=1 Tax=Cucumis melo var. makuwa TaxID=1194695 RepID=A0A5D3BUN8_CUCMM|nr:gag/pol protein [Cucumis melo var. makuwa]